MPWTKKDQCVNLKYAEILGIIQQAYFTILYPLSSVEAKFTTYSYNKNQERGHTFTKNEFGEEAVC